MKLSVVIPAYNEAENLPKILQETQNNLSKINELSSYEIFICDDHSSDDTIQYFKNNSEPNVTHLRLSKRSGSHVAIRAGLDHASGDAVLVISADGQDDSSVLEQMLNHFKNGYHVVWGVRNTRDEPFFHKQFSILFYKLLNLFVPNENEVDLANADFYLLSRVAVEAVKECKERNTSLFGLIAWMGFNQTAVKYDRKARYSGKSKWNFKSKMKLTLDWIIAFSGIPLRLITYLGITTATIGFIYAFTILTLSIMGKTTPGWAETAILILTLGGIQMVMIGIIGEYLWRNLDESRKRPLYFLEKKDLKNEL